ncbi:MAG: hypothetical protein ABIQ72_03400 [Usitatibacter sp.]
MNVSELIFEENGGTTLLVLHEPYHSRSLPPSTTRLRADPRARSPRKEARRSLEPV